MAARSENPANEIPVPPGQKNITYRRVVDLSHKIHPGIPRWPGDPPVQITPSAKLEQDGYRLNAFSMGEHSGTHLNAPNSFHAQGDSVDAYAAESLIVPAVVVDIRDRAGANSDYNLTSADVEAWEQRWGLTPKGSLVLLLTGWSEKWANPREFFGYDPQGRMHFPGFSLDCARLLLDQRGVAGLGTDTHGLDSGLDDTFAVNKLVLEQPRISLENLTNLRLLPAVGSTLVIGILRLKAGAGSPVSVLALTP
ncbi:MAG: cyclase [SAR202 cluster bacterium Io17-Chloro-G9]|nr:MAG: cyclase [SAR202 cluster bacterium Io17-Chloro-G9]